MNRLALGAVAAALAVLVPGSVAAQADPGHWSVQYDEENDICWMQQIFDAAGDATSSLGVDLPWEETPLLIMRNSSWNMKSGDTTAEVWFTEDWERPADTSVPAKFHQVGTMTHIDVSWSDELLERMAGSETVILRIANGPFERYTMGSTADAVASLLDCYEGLDKAGHELPS